ncbi:formamidase [Paxillus involutus ATCC 200175]|nr:formamidase [Paxillus involutus ATCC 200175]
MQSSASRAISHGTRALRPGQRPCLRKGAQPGDTLQIDVLKVQTGEWGWTALIPGFGLLTDEFPEPALKIWDLPRLYAYLNREKGIRVLLRPFAGEMGVARSAPGAWSTIPPYVTGGNLDTKHLMEGSTLYLPVEVEGALFSIGVGSVFYGTTLHDASEVCGTAIETPMDVSVRLTVRKDRPYTKTPHFSTTVTPSTVAAANGEELTGSVSNTNIDIREATRSAVRNMIAYLVAEHGLERVEAYMLCSVAGDLKMHEVVDMPNYVIGMMIPKSVLGAS